MPNVKSPETERQEPQPQKKAYQAPRLKVHGSIVELTKADPGFSFQV